MTSIINALNSTAFNAFGAPTTWAEIFGFITGGLAVYLTVRAKALNFPISLLNALFFFILFINAKLYADAYLQVLFFALSVWGWIVWLKFGPNHDRRPIGSASPLVLGLVIVFIVVFTHFFRPVLESHDDPYPTLDALTTGISIGAQILLSLKFVQTWYWIVADLFYIPLYQAKGLTLTAIIYCVFLTLCFIGLREWRKEREEERAMSFFVALAHLRKRAAKRAQA